MKLLFFDDFKLGVLKGDNVVEVGDVVQDIPHIGPHDLISGLIARRLALASTATVTAGFWACADGASHAANAHPDNNAKAETRTGRPPGWEPEGTPPACV